MSDSITIIDENKVIDVVLIVGRILLEAGAETYRVEDTMNRIAHSYGLHDTYSFVTSTPLSFHSMIEQIHDLLESVNVLQI